MEDEVDAPMLRLDAVAVAAVGRCRRRLVAAAGGDDDDDDDAPRLLKEKEMFSSFPEDVLGKVDIFLLLFSRFLSDSEVVVDVIVFLFLLSSISTFDCTCFSFVLVSSPFVVVVVLLVFVIVVILVVVLRFVLGSSNFI